MAKTPPTPRPIPPQDVQDALDALRADHARWADATFGKDCPASGPLLHMAKECGEAAAQPGDLSEWADLWFLLWDAQRCAGLTDNDVFGASGPHALERRKQEARRLAVTNAQTWPPQDALRILSARVLHLADLPEAQRTARGRLALAAGFRGLWQALWQAQITAGVKDLDLLPDARAKLAVNKARHWPTPVPGQPVEHVRA